MSTVQPTYVNHAHLPGTSRVPSNIEAVLTAALLELANKIDKNKAMHHGASEFSEENTYSAGVFVWHTDASVPENSGLYICKEDVTVPGPWTGSANWTSMNSVSALFSRDNTLMMQTLDYVVGDSGNPEDRTVRTLGTLSVATTITIAAPRAAGKLRDFAVTFTEPSTAVGVTFNTTDAGGSSLTFYGEFLSPSANNTYIYYLTEIAANTFLVKGEQISTVTPPTI